MTEDTLRADPTVSPPIDDASTTPASTLLCFSHLRWDFVFQRPQHLMTRFARHARVYYIEEPVYEAVAAPKLRMTPRDAGLVVATPVLPHGLDARAQRVAQMSLVDQLIRDEAITTYDAWYYTPMALAFSSHLAPRVTVYDCMDELSHFRGAPAEMLAREQQLLGRADLVFTGGQSLYEAKRDRHASVHAFPSSIDRAHFAQARGAPDTPVDQLRIPGPRLGFFGVIDERFDIELLEQVAMLRPRWHFVLVGPVVKIDPASLPTYANIHYLGMKSYAELPAYLAGWDVAIMPFARNDATRYISPTKTPEYLAGGRPVVSTSIRDVVRPYGENGLVGIADTPEAFVAACEEAMDREPTAWLRRVDAFLADGSWDETFARMRARMIDVAVTRASVRAAARSAETVA